jgi:hypothetical protein
MKKKMSIVITGLMLALLVVGVIGATGAFAQGSAATLFHGGHGPGGDGRGFGLGQVELEAAAKVLGMTADELSTALQSGKTLERVATDKGVDIQKVQDAIQAAHATEMRNRIQQALKDGTITQANADWLLEGLDQGYIGVPGAFGFGGPHGPGADRPLAQPTQQTNP